jgi:hypothetical protein
MDFFRKPVKKRVIDHNEPIPVGEVQESDWAAWEDSVGPHDGQSAEFQSTDKQPLSRAEGDFMDVFAAAVPKGQ